MAVWIYAYGRNGLLKELPLSESNQEYLNLLNSLAIKPLLILESVLQANALTKKFEFDIMSQKELIRHYKSMGDKEWNDLLNQIGRPNLTREEWIKEITNALAAKQSLNLEKESLVALFRQNEKANVLAPWQVMARHTFCKQDCW